MKPSTKKRLFITLMLWIAFFSYLFSPITALAHTQVQKETQNLNVLFVGWEDDQPEMISIYTINHQDRMQSAAIFLPVQATFPGENLTLRQIYLHQGLETLRQKIQQYLNIEIAYHVIIRNQIMTAVEDIIGPLTLDGDTPIDLSRIFTMPPGPRDNQLLGELVARFTKPEVYFWQLPRLVLAARQYVTTDFPLTAENLLLHYRIASRIPTQELVKVILPVKTTTAQGRPRPELVKNGLQDIVHKLTHT